MDFGSGVGLVLVWLFTSCCDFRIVVCGWVVLGFGYVTAMLAVGWLWLALSVCV